MDPKTIAKELKRRTQQASKAPIFDLSTYLFKEQLEFVRDPAKFKTAVCSVRAGKTTACAGDLVSTALSKPGVTCLYLAPTRAQAERVIWGELQRLNEDYKLGGDVNQSKLSIKFPNKSVIYVSGAKDKKEVGKFLGIALALCYIDECQLFGSYIETLVDDVISKRLYDYNGTLVLTGTPGPIPMGYFFQCSQAATWSHHYWTMFNNPWLQKKSGLTPMQLVERDLTRKGVTLEHPSIQRECYGRWVLDSDALVFKYKQEKNDYVQLPNLHWNYVLGIDIGFHDADALAVLAWSEQSPNTYLVEEIVVKQQGITELVNQIEQLKSKYTFQKIVMDTAGLGKKIGEELSKRYSIAIEPAEKARKLEYIELMNDALRTGRFLVPKGSQFSQDAMRVEWDVDKSRPDKRVVSDRFHSDICDAVLYAWRCSYSFAHTPTANPPKYGSKAWQDAEEDRMWQAEVEKAEKEKELQDNDFLSNPWKE